MHSLEQPLTSTRHLPRPQHKLNQVILSGLHLGLLGIQRWGRRRVDHRSEVLRDIAAYRSDRPDYIAGLMVLL